MSTIENIKSKIENKEKLTISERLLKMVHDQSKSPRIKDKIEHKNDMIRYFLSEREKFELTEQDIQLLTQELNHEN